MALIVAYVWYLVRKVLMCVEQVGSSAWFGMLVVKDDGQVDLAELPSSACWARHGEGHGQGSPSETCK